MIKQISVIILLLVTLLFVYSPVASTTTFFYDDFDGTSLSASWNIENRGGSYILNNSILTISASGEPYDSMAIYMEYIPQADNFTVSTRVKATSLSSFLLRIHAGPLPIFGSVDGAQLEFNSASSDHFLAVWWTTYWYWTTIYQPSETGVWYVLEMQGQRSPFAITYNVYNDSGVLLGTTTATNIGNFGYNDICYICLYVGAGGPNPPVYDVDWLKIEEGEIIPPAVTEPSVEWYRTYGGIGEERTWGWRSVIETSDGGYALVGSTTSFGAGNRDFWLLKTDVSGNVQWNRTYGRLYIDDAYSVIQTNDGGYAVAGASWNQSRNAFDLFLVKTDADGNMEWNLTYIRDNSGGYLDWGCAWSIIQTTDEGYIIAGSVRHHPDHPTGDWDGWLVKTDANGTVEWDKPYGGGADEGAHDVLQTVDGGYIFVGTTLSYGAGSGDVWLVKTDAGGNQQWVKTFGGSNWDDGWSISRTPDAGYIIGGATSSFGAGSYDFWLIKTDANGTQQWTESYGGINEDFAWSVVETDDGGYALAGHTKSFGAGGSDLWLVKTDSSGNQEWNKTFGGVNYDEATSVIQTSDGGYVIAGYTNSFGAGSHDFLLVKLVPPSPQPTPPVANFAWSPSMPITGESVTFDASSSLPGWNGTHTMPIVLYSWDFGDGNTSNGQIVTHTYANQGNYTVTLNVTDSEGLWDVEQEQIQVGQPHGPKAEFTATPEIVPPGETVEFDASASLLGWNGTHTTPITEYRWNFGDDNITSTVDPVIAHIYAFPGVFNVTLTARDSEGLNSSCSQIILVVTPTFVSISTSSSSTFVGFAVDINGTLHDFYGNGLENEPVVLYYTFPGVTTWFPISSGITDHLGYYYVQWIPTATGYFTIKAEWAGNTTHTETSNNITLSAIPYQNRHVFSVESNSTISALAFNTTNWELSFTASGPSGTRGYVKVTVAKSLVANITNIRVYLDGNQSEYSITSIDDSWLLTFDYIHSTHQVVVDLDINIIPEFSPAMILLLFMIITMLVVIITAKRRFHPKTRFSH